MSIATVQRLLAASTLGDVNIGVYLRQLCESLAASMISEPERIRIVVSADESCLPANLSISLGLIVTELVINALKHAFGQGRAGVVTVSFNTHGAGWTLSVADNGCGISEDQAQAKPGLGTSIIQAIAQQLGSSVVVSDNHPGTMVRIVEDARSLGTDRPAAA